MNSSYIPIGGALLLSLRKDIRRDICKSLPFCPETKVFVGKDFADSLNLTNEDFMCVIFWDKGDSFVKTKDERVVVNPNYKFGIQDINRLKTLVSLWNKKIRLNTAISMISMWSDNTPFSLVKDNKFIDQQEKWMRADKKIDLFLDLESQKLGTPKLSLSQKEDIRSLLREIQNKDIGLYKVAAQVDSMPKVLDTEKHLAFLPEELSIIERVI